MSFNLDRQFNGGYRFLCLQIYAANRTSRGPHRDPATSWSRKKHTSVWSSAARWREAAWLDDRPYGQAAGSVSDALVRSVDAHSTGIWARAVILMEILLRRFPGRCQEIRRRFSSIARIGT